MSQSAMIEPSQADSTIRRPRITRVDPAVAAALQHLYAQAPCTSLSIDGQPHRWRWLPAGDDAGAVVSLAVGIAGQPCRLSLGEHSNALIDDAIDLSQFEGDALRVAAALRYARILEHLERLLGATVVVQDVDADGSSASAAVPGLALGFLLESLADPQSRCCGRIEVPVGMHERLRRVGGSPADDDPALPPCCIEVLLDVALSLDRQALRQLRPGSAVLLLRGSRISPQPCLVRPRHSSVAWHALLGDGSLHFDSAPLLRSTAPSSTPPGQPLMPPQDRPAEEAQAPADDSTTALLDALPVRIEFLIGELTVPHSEFRRRVTAGGVLPLLQRLDAQAVELRANGVTIARGELIEIGDVLAVRVNRIESHGLF